MKLPGKVSTAILPTPTHKLARVSEISKSDVYIKRDDMTGLAFGGNKLRKLDYIVKYCLDNGYTAVMTFGGNQTNHGRLTAAACAKFGLKSIILTSGKPPVEMSGNLTLDRILGCEVAFFDTADMIQRNLSLPKAEQIAAYLKFRDDCVQNIVDRYKAQGDKVYVLPIGGHTEEGVIGYFDCVAEIMAQEKEMGLEFDYVVVGNGSGGTLAGLLLGKKYYNPKFEIIGINISDKTDEENWKTLSLANKASEKFEIPATIEPSDVYMATNDYTGIGYNVPDAETREAIEKMARLEGILCDPCYSGKVAMGLFDLVEKEIIPAGSKVLFLHTGGTPAIYTTVHHKEFEKELWKDIVVFN